MNAFEIKALFLDGNSTIDSIVRLCDAVAELQQWRDEFEAEEYEAAPKVIPTAHDLGLDLDCHACEKLKAENEQLKAEYDGYVKGALEASNDDRRRYDELAQHRAKADSDLFDCQKKLAAAREEYIELREIIDPEILRSEFGINLAGLDHRQACRGLDRILPRPLVPTETPVWCQWTGCFVYAKQGTKFCPLHQPIHVDEKIPECGAFTNDEDRGYRCNRVLGHPGNHAMLDGAKQVAEWPMVMEYEIPKRAFSEDYQRGADSRNEALMGQVEKAKAMVRERDGSIERLTAELATFREECEMLQLHIHELETHIEVFQNAGEKT